jgi:phospholipase A1/A2
MCLGLLYLLTLEIGFFTFGVSAAPVSQETKADSSTETWVGTVEKRSARKVIAPYKPIYIAYGNPATKIQFSFRSQLSEAVPLNFAYTQIIFWELGKESKPFLDATYNPEFFYRFKPPGQNWGAIDFGIWEHNSNGKGGFDSRSYDQTYVRGVLMKEWEKWALVLSAKLRFFYSIDETNRDIRDYIGPLEVDIRLARLTDYFLEEAEVILTLSPGGKFSTEWSQGGYQIAANYHIRGLKVNPAFYIQYYNGYSETLINYNQRVSQFRLGLMF